MAWRGWSMAVALGLWACVPVGNGPGDGDGAVDAGPDGGPVDARPGADRGADGAVDDLGAEDLGAVDRGLDARVTSDGAPEPEPNPEPDGAPDPEPDAARDGAPDPEPDAARDGAPDPEPDPEPDAAPDPEPDAAPDPEPDAAPDPEPDAALPDQGPVTACGDRRCDPDETCATCPADCGCPAGEVCAAGVCACAPRCAGRVCGDDGCGGSCGACGPDAACVDGACAPVCLDDCGDLWGAACTGDGFGLRLCIPDADRPGCTAPSRRVPCADGRACADGACAGRCVVPEVMVLVDRSSSMVAGGRWAFTRDALDATLATFGRRARLGVRAFPAEEANCAAGEIRVPALDNGAAFAAVPEPSQSAQTPILAAFDAIEPAFGDPDEGEAIVLVTDGDETCADEDGVVARVEALRARGVRTFAVGISRQANGELLARIAAAGGTARGVPAYYLVEDRDGLAAALADVFARLEVCPCAAGDRRCEGDAVLGCRADLDGFEPIEQCAFGCDPDIDACHPVCRPGGAAFECAGDRALVCNPDGDGFGPDGEDCALGCAAPGGCFAVCRAGETRCVDAATVETCRADGSGWDAAPCPDICVLADDRCGASGQCRPGDLRCDDAGLTACDVQGAGFALADACPEICQTYTGRCPTDQLGDAYERDGVLFVRGPDGWGGVSAIDGWGVTLGCFLLGYSSSGGAAARVPAAHPAGRPTYQLTCAGAGWLGECQMVRSDRAGRAADGVDPDCGAPRLGSSRCVADDVSFAWLDGAHRPYLCPDGCDPEPGVCRAAAFECNVALGALCRLGEHEVMIARTFGPRDATIDVTLDQPVDTGISIYRADFGAACAGRLSLRITDAGGAEVHAAEGACDALFSFAVLDAGRYRMTLSNPQAGRAYDLRIALQTRGPRAP